MEDAWRTIASPFTAFLQVAYGSRCSREIYFGSSWIDFQNWSCFVRDQMGNRLFEDLKSTGNIIPSSLSLDRDKEKGLVEPKYTLIMEERAFLVFHPAVFELLSSLSWNVLISNVLVICIFFL